MRRMISVVVCCLLAGCAESPSQERPAETLPQPSACLPVSGSRFRVGYQVIDTPGFTTNLELFTIQDDKTGREYTVLAREKTLLELTGQPHASPSSQPASYE